jgi:catechol O-methyltransferase
MTLRQHVPTFRLSLRPMAAASRTVTKTGQIVDGREQAVVDRVLANSRQGDIDSVLDTMDRYAYDEPLLMNTGDETGELLDTAVRRANPVTALELGTHCGYSALRIARVARSARVFSIAAANANAVSSRRIWAHAGVGERVTCVVGTVGDGGHALQTLADDHGVGDSDIDFVLLDHDKDAYLPDLQRLLDRRWLRPRTVVVANNVEFPGSPTYREFMRDHQGLSWQTIEHKTHGEYGAVLPNLVLESLFVG